MLLVLLLCVCSPFPNHRLILFPRPIILHTFYTRRRKKNLELQFQFFSPFLSFRLPTSPVSIQFPFPFLSSLLKKKKENPRTLFFSCVRLKESMYVRIRICSISNNLVGTHCKETQLYPRVLSFLLPTPTVFSTEFKKKVEEWNGMEREKKLYWGL